MNRNKAITVEQAHNILNCCKSYVYRLVSDGNLEVVSETPLKVSTASVTSKIINDYPYLRNLYSNIDNNIQTRLYNVPQEIRDMDWPEYNKLQTTGLDPYSPRTVFRNIERLEDGLCYINGEIYYSNWPMIVSREGNRKMFIETTWAHPFEQTWMSHMYQETKKGNLKPAVLLASPVTHERFKYYPPEERREN